MAQGHLESELSVEEIKNKVYKLRSYQCGFTHDVGGSNFKQRCLKLWLVD